MTSPAAPQPSPGYQGERTLLTARPTRLIAFRWWALTFLSLLLSGGFFFGIVGRFGVPKATLAGYSTNDLVALFFLFVAFVAFLVAEVRRRTTRYIITDNKIIREDGILSKNTQMMPYTVLNRVDLKQSFGQRILGIGTVVVDTGDDTLEIEHVKNPKKIQGILSQRLGRQAWSAGPTR